MVEVSWPGRIPACPSPRGWDQTRQLHKQDTNTQHPCWNVLDFPGKELLGEQGLPVEEQARGKSQI